MNESSSFFPTEFPAPLQYDNLPLPDQSSTNPVTTPTSMTANSLQFKRNNSTSSSRSTSHKTLQPEISCEIQTFDKESLKTPSPKEPKRKEEMSNLELVEHRLLERSERIQTDSEEEKDTDSEKWEEAE